MRHHRNFCRYGDHSGSVRLRLITYYRKVVKAGLKRYAASSAVKRALVLAAEVLDYRAPYLAHTAHQGPRLRNAAHHTEIVMEAVRERLTPAAVLEIVCEFYAYEWLGPGFSRIEALKRQVAGRIFGRAQVKGRFVESWTRGALARDLLGQRVIDKLGVFAVAFCKRLEADEKPLTLGPARGTASPPEG